LFLCFARLSFSLADVYFCLAGLISSLHFSFSDSVLQSLQSFVSSSSSLPFLLYFSTKLCSSDLAAWTAASSSSSGLLETFGQPLLFFGPFLFGH